MPSSIKMISGLVLGLMLAAGGVWWFTLPKELTLADFQPRPAVVDPFWKSLQASDLDPSEWVKLAAANEDCQLGISGGEINAMMGSIELLIQMSSGAEGAYLLLLTGLGRDYPPPRQSAQLLDLRWQAHEWSNLWNASPKVVREYECSKLMRSIRKVRGF